MASAIELLELATCEFRAMGTDVHVLIVDGSDDHLHWARAEVERLEARWSRFREDSEVSRVNRHPGSHVEVSTETLDIVQRAVQARAGSGGAFDPLLGADIAGLGYDRSFEDVDVECAGARRVGRGAPGEPRTIAIDEEAQTVCVAPGTALDLGGIAKGWTADLLVTGLLARGADGACANLGGDVAVGGRAPHPEGWVVEIEHTAARWPDPRIVAVRTGGVATSTTLRRAWRGPSGDRRHHLLDPRTGMSVGEPLAEVTVVASTATDAEVLTKVAFAAPEWFARALATAGAAAILTTRCGESNEVGDVGLLRVDAVRRGDGAR